MSVAYKIAKTIRKDRPIASFDFDDTLAPFKNKTIDADLTWRVLNHMTQCFNVVIFTNKSDTKAIESYIGDAQISYFASKAHDKCRKPHTGMWHLALEALGLDKVPPGSFFCGDAAGRSGDKTVKPDFAASDLHFARHFGVRFLTPEHIFGGLRWPKELIPPECNPDFKYGAEIFTNETKGVQNALKVRNASHEFELKAALSQPNVAIVMVGSPGSGKSTFAHKFCADHNIPHIEMDIAKKLPAVLPARVLIDATHATIEKRREVLSRAKFKMIIHMATSKELSLHLNAYRREKNEGGQLGVPEIAIHTYWKRFEPPTKAECDFLHVAEPIIDEDVKFYRFC
jgi:bifunctional polynucleotide phosphatase/kinase